MADDINAKVEDHEQRITTVERGLDVQQNTCKLTIEHIKEGMEKHSADIQEAKEAVKKNTKWTVSLILGLIGTIIAVSIPIVYKVLS